jgi:hypothetical protein
MLACCCCECSCREVFVCKRASRAGWCCVIVVCYRCTAGGKNVKCVNMAMTGAGVCMCVLAGAGCVGDKRGVGRRAVAVETAKTSEPKKIGQANLMEAARNHWCLEMTTRKHHCKHTENRVRNGDDTTTSAFQTAGWGAAPLPLGGCRHYYYYYYSENRPPSATHTRRRTTSADTARKPERHQTLPAARPP